MTTIRNATIGEISSATLRNADLLANFAFELKRLSIDPDHIALAAESAARASRIEDDPDSECEEDSNCVAALFEALDSLAPAYCYFGAADGDGASFGFWPSFDSIEDLPKFNDLAEVPADIEDDYCVVNDHGNLSLYSASGAPLWAIV